MDLAVRAALLLFGSDSELSDTDYDDDDDDDDSDSDKKIVTLQHSKVDPLHISIDNCINSTIKQLKKSTKPKVKSNSSNSNLLKKPNDLNLFEVLLNATDTYFKELLKISKDTFNFILDEYKEIQNASREPKRPKIEDPDIERDFMIFFYYLSTECPINEITKDFHLDNSIISMNIIKKIEKFIINHLQNLYITWPSTIIEQKMLNKDFRHILYGKMGITSSSSSSSIQIHNDIPCIGMLAYIVIKIKSQTILTTEPSYLKRRAIRDQSEKLLIAQNVIDFNNIFRHTETFYSNTNANDDQNDLNEIEIFKKSLLHQRNINNSFPLYQKNFLHSSSIQIENYLSHPKWIKNIGIISDEIKNSLNNIQNELLAQIENRFSRLRNLELFTACASSQLSSSLSSSYPDPGNVYKTAVILHNICLNRDDYYDCNVQIKKEE